MKAIKHTGFVLFLVALTIFTGTLFTGSFQLSKSELDAFLKEKNYKSTVIRKALEDAVITDKKLTIFQFSARVRKAYEKSNSYYDALITKYNAAKNWDKK